MAELSGFPPMHRVVQTLDCNVDSVVVEYGRLQAQQPMEKEMKSEALKGCDLDLSEIGSRDGLRVFAARDCRVKCDDLLIARFAPPAERDDHADDEMPADEAPKEDPADEGEEKPDEDRKTEGMVLMSATASSTGVDHHGTEMSLEALRGMADQMKGGVVYLPAHSKAEWDDVIGYTVDAEVVEGMVMKGGHTGKEEDGYHLRVTVGLYEENEKAQQLMRAIKRPPSVIGTSIGGWFTDVEFMVDDDDKVKRVIIKAVELDHLATTRRPSNRESYIEGLRSRCEDALQSVDAPEERHIISVEEKEETVTVVYGKSDKWQGVEPMPASEADSESATEEEKEGQRSVEQEVHSNEEVAATVSDVDDGNLDTRDCAGEDGAGPDADQCAVPTLEQSPIEDGSMSEHIEPAAEAPVADARMDRLERSLEQLTGLVAKLAERTTVEEPVITPEQRAAELENKVQSLQAKLARTMATAGRVGLGHVTRERVAAAGGFTGMVQRSADRLGDTSALRMVCEAQAARRDATRTETPDRASLESDLRSVLAAALADGFINDPDAAAGWEG